MLNRSIALLRLIGPLIWHAAIRSTGVAIAAMAAVLALSLTLAGCATQQQDGGDMSQAAGDETETAQPSQADIDLAAGIKLYDAGKYPEAMLYLQRAVDAVPTYSSDLADAHKHLAFIHCAATRIEPCREEFRLAIEADPDFALTPAEIGHPIWGPVYRSVKDQK